MTVNKTVSDVCYLGFLPEHPIHTEMTVNNTDNDVCCFMRVNTHLRGPFDKTANLAGVSHTLIYMSS